MPAAPSPTPRSCPPSPPGRPVREGAPTVGRRSGVDSIETAYGDGPAGPSSFRRGIGAGSLPREVGPSGRLLGAEGVTP